MKNSRCKIIWRILATATIMALLVSGCGKKGNDSNETTKSEEQTTEKEKKPEYSFEQEKVQVKKYYIYGTRFNFEGQLTTNKNISSVQLIAAADKEYKFDCIFSKNKKLQNTFNLKISKWINEGMDLDQFENGEYQLLLAVTDADGKVSYYSMENKTKYPKAEYYTMTKNNTNQKVTFADEFKMTVTDEKEPDGLYDIAIDPGHGGLDTGAAVGDLAESEIGLNVGKKVKELLEQKGYKVMLTRDGSEDSSYTAYNTFDKNGRVTLTCKAKAKYAYSIHCNSTEASLSQGGAEVYLAPAAKETMAKNIVDAMCSASGMDYSAMKSYRRCKGVYAKGHDESAKQEIIRYANAAGYKPFHVTSNTPYLYMIRETGGIVTGAFNDGRMPKYSANKYYKSNVATETYLIELGYLTVDKDLSIIKNKQDKLAQGIADGIIKSLQKTE